MFRIHVVRNRQPLGDFTREEVAEGLVSGQFLPTDLAWHEPMDAWKPLSEFDHLPSVSSAVTPPPLEVAPEPPPSSTIEPAWERRAEIGVFAALYETIRQVYSAPLYTFRSMALSGGLGAPLGFYVILATVSLWASLGYQVATTLVNPALAMGPMSKSMTPSMVIASEVVTFFIAPLFVMVAAFIAAGIFHGALTIMGAAKGNYEVTFRAFCYAAGPAALLQLIPFCGPPLYIFVTMVLLIIAFREVHAVETWRVSIGVVVPTLFCFVSLLGTYSALLAAAGALK